MTLRMLVASGPDEGLVIPLVGRQALVIGRGTESDFQLSDPGVSRRHVRVDVNGRAMTLTDLGSSGGTFVNDQRVQSCRLRARDRIRLGETVLMFAPEPDSATTIIRPLPANSPRPDGPDAAGLESQVLHVYEVRRKLAEGRSGVVYNAWDTKAGRDVALKVLWPEFVAEEEQRKRFLRAMKTMFAFRHPNVIRIYAAGKSKALVWVAMEYCPGESLTKIIERSGTAGMLDWTMGLRVAVQIGRALEAAYDRTIIHRNITPKNILYDGDRKLAKLGDLMLAKALHGAGAQQVTAKGQVVGELAYLAPERLAGDEARIDCRSDIYSLGTTVYALLTGRPPFEGRTLPDLLSKVRSQKPERPKRFQLSVNDMFEGVVLRMLEKSPEDRYQTPTSLLADLERVGRYQGLTV